MKMKLAIRLCSIAALGVLLVLPLSAALAAPTAGGCCFTEITIKNLDTGRQVTISGPALTQPYDLSTFFSFSDFEPAAKSVRSGPAYEVARDGWDHLVYYPGTGRQPGVVYYEGLFNGSSEYDGRWFLVPAAQDAALRQALIRQGFPSAGATWAPSLSVLATLAVAAALALGGLGLYSARNLRLRRTTLVGS